MSLQQENPAVETGLSAPTGNGPTAAPSAPPETLSRPDSLPRARRRLRRARWVIWPLLGIFIFYAAGFAIAGISRGKARLAWWTGDQERFDGPVWTVKKERLQLAIVE